MTPLLPTGFRDRLPPVADALARIEARILAVAALHGYERVDPPLVEFEQALTTRLKGTGASDAVRFVDPVSQQTLAIRPDLTAQVARIAATRMGHHPRPVRLAYAGPVLRLTAPELSPERERRQIGCELIGLDTVAAAREIVTVAVEGLAAAGIARLSIDLTLPDCITMLARGPLPLPAERIGELADALDAKDAGRVAAIAPAYLPLIAAAGPFAPALARLRAFDTAQALAGRLDGLERIAADLGAAAVTLDPTERHGFEYQSWFGFSVFAEGALSEIGRGGAYTVIHENGAEEAATGFSLYADAIVAAGLTEGERRRLFVPTGTDPSLAARLRREGWVTVAALEAGDTPEAQLCTHVLRNDAPTLL